MFDIEQFIRNFFKQPIPAQKANWQKVFTAMAVHTKKAIPADLLLCRRPNETTEIFNYRIKTYKPITYGSMNRATDELYRIVSGINYKLNAPDSTKQLLEEKLYNNFTFVMFLQQIVLRRMLEDPNGLLVWLPWNYSGDTAEKVIPIPNLVYSHQIHYMDENVVSYLSDEKSMVMVGKHEVPEGNVFYILTTDSFYKLVQIGKKSDNNYQTQLIIQHNIGEIPYSVLGGDMNDHNYFDSFFAPYLAFGDEAICQFSDWQAVMVTSSHPFIEEFEQDCEVVYSHPSKDSNPIPEGEEEYQRREKESKPFGRSPYNRIRRRIPTKDGGLMDEAILDATVPSIRFIHPDISIAKYCGEAWQMLIEMAEDSLHLNLGRGLISGDAKKEDKTAQQSMILKIGNNVFDNLFLNSVVYADAYNRYVKADRGGISIDKPKTYDIKTEADILTEITTLKEKNAPAFFLANSTIDLARKRFSGDKLMQKVFTMISLLDPLYIYSVAEKNQLVISGVITKNAYITSVYIYSLLLQIADEMTADEFIKADMASISEKLDAKMVAFLPEEADPILDPSGAPA
jgi:hypothetical protein